MRIMLIPCIALFLTACATTNTDENSLGSAGPDLPPIAILSSALSEDLRKDCSAYREQSILHFCVENQYDIHTLTNTLRDTGRFENVSYGQSQADYQVLISATKKHHDDAKGLANAVVSGASLTLIPMHFEMTLNAEFVVLWRGQVIDRFSHEFPATRSASMFKLEQDYGFVGRVLAERLMSDIDQHNPFTAERLAEVLESSDYAQLEIPEELADYRQTDQYRYHDPLMGSMVSYAHNQFDFDRIDVFVYPIRSTDWTDTQQIVETEMENIHAEILHLEKEGYIKDVKLNTSRASRWDSEPGSTVVGFMDGYYANQEVERAYTASYAFIQEDKFVKVRATFPITDEGSEMRAPDEFVSALLSSVSVPKESLFMARIRKRHRETSMND